MGNYGTTAEWGACADCGTRYDTIPLYQDGRCEWCHTFYYGPDDEEEGGVLAW